MKLEVLLSCMHQKDAALVRDTRITGDAVVINQCDQPWFAEFATQFGSARIYSVTERGLSRSRNLAIEKARADICLLCDDDECMAPDYQQQILQAYERLPQADVLIFQVGNTPKPFGDSPRRLRFPMTMKVCSVQISFRRECIVNAGIHFDPLMGAGTGNGAEEELKFLMDCQKAGLQIWYAPAEIATLNHAQSTWFSGFHEQFFENRGATTRYVLGTGLAGAYAIYYVIAKRNLYRQNLTPMQALRATFRGIRENKIGIQAAQELRK